MSDNAFHKHVNDTGHIRYKGEFDYQALFSLFQNFFFSREFDFTEKRYKDKGNEHEVTLQFFRDYDEFHLITFTIDFHVEDEVPIKRTYGKNPVRIISARVDITVKGELDLDYNVGNTMYDQSQKSGKLLAKMHNFVVQRDLDEHWEELCLDLQEELMQEIKECLHMTDIAQHS